MSEMSAFIEGSDGDSQSLDSGTQAFGNKPAQNRYQSGDGGKYRGGHNQAHKSGEPWILQCPRMLSTFRYFGKFAKIEGARNCPVNPYNEYAAKHNYRAGPCCVRK